MDERLYRSTDDRMLAGVAGGLAEMWDADPSLVRIIWAFLALFTGGLALVVYIVMAIVIPERPDAWMPASGPVTPGAGWTPGAAPAAGMSRSEARAARRAARAAARAERRRHGPSGAAIVVGTLLIVIGAVFLARQWLPEIEFDWLWPVALIVLGGALLVTAVSRGDDTSRAPSMPGAPWTPGTPGSTATSATPDPLSMPGTPGSATAPGPTEPDGGPG